MAEEKVAKAVALKRRKDWISRLPFCLDLFGFSEQAVSLVNVARLVQGVSERDALTQFLECVAAAVGEFDRFSGGGNRAGNIAEGTLEFAEVAITSRGVVSISGSYVRLGSSARGCDCYGRAANGAKSKPRVANHLRIGRLREGHRRAESKESQKNWREVTGSFQKRRASSKDCPDRP